MKAVLRTVRISPKKVNLVAGLVRGKPVEWALDFLKFTPKSSARPLMKTLQSAVANAEENFKQKRKDLYISKLVITEGPMLKRSRAVSRGRSHPILKKTAHIWIEVAVMAATEPEVKGKPEKKTKVVKTQKTAPTKTSTKKNETASAPEKEMQEA
ncbi:50S ribosomal protein L22 [Candidatus Peregrinibacteria bacterium CG_4_9_14_0_2_um_filter_53_11]|nr:MAG: 50S ribosomal protein L22 [Candidatus Peregrinibacteria bacterium CG_4_9_14_0_2_um_filter_53_11]